MINMINELKTPCYVVDYKKFEQNCRTLMKEFEMRWGNNVIYGYSVKTNRYAGLIKYAYSRLGWKIETVSLDEYNYCIELGIKPEDIILNGPCKIIGMDTAMQNSSIINLDNLNEVEKFCKLNRFSDDSLVGLRINFDLESVCPGQTTAGNEASRFGIDSRSQDIKNAIDLLKNNGIKKIGLHMHTSTKSRSVEVFAAISDEVLRILKILRENKLELSYVDIGGGFFGGQVLANKPSMKEYATVICNKLLQELNPQNTMLILEPGASVLATCVTYVTRVLNIREVRKNRIVTLDGTILHINPFMSKREQLFDMETIDKRNIIDRQIICGSTCMENDRLNIIENQAELLIGDILYYKNVGAYTMVFNNHFIFNPPNVFEINKSEEN